MFSQSQKEGFVKEHDFLKIKGCFDTHEGSIDRHYSIPFARVEFLKELLFRINKENRNGEMKVNVKKYISLIKAKE